MKEGYRLLGDFIRQVDVRNTDGKEEISTKSLQVWIMDEYLQI